ncbi:alkaline phosphatase family protein [Mesoterricola sediminis]|uniref:Alkaline phosphatase family protein n=1 Tax=Mesoterricola sediminis TaxID=2927980 RepID=A0AA48KCK1_9BACT|nr:nucleotide pyrophosphatase/phosphodiesterase family protein [Mesoterricola sediminis]BDU77166.1 alkaline phosphatase family protein [Mesoterricola sediminis]
MRPLTTLLFCSTLALSAEGPVVVLSFDGLGALQFTAHTMPRFHKLAKTGQRGEGIPPAPATTFNGHATLATGCYPEHHGIVGNHFVDPQKGLVTHSAKAEWLQREPLWVAATRSGVRTAVYHWPCADGPWNGVAPWRFETFKEGVPDKAALAFADQALAEGARLVMAYLSGTDTEGHETGPQSTRTARKLAKLDREVAPWVAKLSRRYPGIRVLLLADHGMVPMGQRIDIRPLLGGPAQVAAHGGGAYVYPEGALDPGAVERLGAAGLKTWTHAEIPAAFHLAANPRVGALLVEAPLGAWIAGETEPRRVASEIHGRHGAHGYFTPNPPMNTWLVALGTGRTTPLPPTPLWNIAPTVATWLNIRWAETPDGAPVKELLP